MTVYDNQTGPDSVFLLDTHLIFEVCTRIWGEDNEECEEKRESLLSGVFMILCLVLYLSANGKTMQNKPKKIERIVLLFFLHCRKSPTLHALFN